MHQLIHNGVLFPTRYEWKEFRVLVKGIHLELTPEQEEMAVAWVKKLGTDYVNDRVFAKNFFQDFKKALNLNEEVNPEDFDFSEIQAYIEGEKARKEALSKEEKKELAKQRKILREANKDRFGCATVDGEKTEIGNYTAEPSSIFMGRGKHPLRGRWKQGPTSRDVTLNLSPDAPTPKGEWKERVWKPDEMWIAKWEDKLRGKLKHVWLSDSSCIKQNRDIEKFNKALELEAKIGQLKAHIMKNLQSEDIMRRKIATVCYLIDALKLRVGDEKDNDEADTVGATTLRPEHITFGSNGKIFFDFLGKDSVRWQKDVVLNEAAIRNLQELTKIADSSIFKGVRSSNVSAFLGEVMEGLTAKVFRTYHATKAVDKSLSENKVTNLDPDYVKKHVALMANLQAAIICNHKRTPPKTWRASLEKKLERLHNQRVKKTEASKRAAKKLQLNIEEMKSTRDYNLRTSLKSYIDPRIYFEWGKEIDFDWKLYYPRTLQTKFSWVENTNLDVKKLINKDYNSLGRST